MTISVGDMVDYRDGSEIRHMIVARWSGDADRNLLLMDQKGATARPLLHEVTRMAPAAADAIQGFFEPEWMKKHLKEYDESPKATRYDRAGKCISSEWGVDPSEGRGFLPDCQEPTKLAVGFTSELTGQMVRFLDYSQNPYEATLAAMKRFHPAWYETYMANVVNGEKLSLLAQRLGISEANVRQRNSRAQKYVKETTPIIRLLADEAA